MGEEHGEAAPFQFFSDHIDEEIAIATREGRRREFAGFAEFAGEEVPDPQDPETFRALQAHAHGRARGAARPLRAAARAPAARSAPARPRPTTTSTPAGCACAAATHLVLANFAAQPRARARRPRRSSSLLATHHATVEPGHVVLPAAVRSAAAMTVDAVWPGQHLPARRDVGRRRHELLALLRARRARRAVPVRRRRRGAARRADRAHRAQLALLPARASARASATATACTAPTSPRRATASTRPSC